MSNPESFIDEVTEEVRRDRLFGYFRKYGWIGVLIVLGTVGGAAYSEWQKSTKAAASQAFGDAVLAAMEVDTPEARSTALAAVSAEGDRKAILQLMLASDPAESRDAALTALKSVMDDASLPVLYRDLATLRHVILIGTDQPVSERRAALDPLTAPGRPFRTLALEQMAYLSIEAGEADAAITTLQDLAADQESPAGLRQRATQMIVALGGDVAKG